MNSETNGVDTNTIFASTNGGNYVYVDWSSWLPFEAQPPTAAEWASYGATLVYAGLLMLWTALVEFWREALR